MSAFTARRMKKRPSFGIRSVELARSGSGFGFTVSGQQPAILSNIVPHSPAHVAGLRAGDHVIAVNGLNVSKHTHEAVVEAIGQSLGILSLQIAEDYCSSSDDERDLNESAPRNSGFFSDDEEYAGGGRVPWLRPIHVRGNSADSTLTEASIPPRPRPKKSSPKKMAKVGPTRSAMKMPSPSKSKQVDLMGSEELHLTETEINSFLHPTLSELRQSIKQRNTQYNQIAVDESLYKAVVGYLGTIEMPKEKDPSSSNNLMAIRNCIKRLRVEKKVHTMVLMCIFEDKIVLINHHGLKLADYPSNQITFCGKCTDDKRFFGLVTTRSLDLDHEGFSSSCHVFMTEPVTDQVEMDRRAKAFQFELTYHNHDPQLCREFPSNADTIIHVVKATFGKNEEAAGGAASVASGGLSPAANSTTTSNSDSGIGFRDDNNQPANGADRVLMLDVQHQRFQMQNLNRLHE
ncbi:regulator of G-protein signaling loco-like, partial [Tigriopus californicus]|uniref:regulator of G-protein signaling loco-like n=1 Tax=Tigriopus californicus TaxID=6832 RepID=UPI0027DA1BAD